MQAFASADIFVMPSDSETLGFVVIESMASGVPVVGARAGGIPSIIEDGVTGLLANPRDPADFAVKVKSLLEDRGKLATMAAAASAEMRRWDWEAATSYLRNVQYRMASENFRNNRSVPYPPSPWFFGVCSTDTTICIGVSGMWTLIPLPAATCSLTLTIAWLSSMPMRATSKQTASHFTKTQGLQLQF